MSSIVRNVRTLQIPEDQVLYSNYHAQAQEPWPLKMPSSSTQKKVNPWISPGLWDFHKLVEIDPNVLETWENVI